MSLSSPYQQKTIKNYQIFLAKDYKDYCIVMNINQKVRIEIQQTSIDIFSNQTFSGVNRLFVLIYSNKNNDINRTLW